MPPEERDSALANIVMLMLDDGRHLHEVVDFIVRFVRYAEICIKTVRMSRLMRWPKNDEYGAVFSQDVDNKGFERPTVL